MKNIMPFDFDGNSIRAVIGEDGEPWFVARDVALVLGYVDPADAIQRHCKKANDSNIGVSPGIPSPKIIPESDLYRLVMRSNLPSAERFQDWIVEEVLPAIRRHGGYLTPAMTEQVLSDPDTIIRLATDLKRERERRAALEAKAEQDKPKVIFAESVETAANSVLVRELAIILKQNGHDIGQNRLFDWLRDNGYLVSSGSSRNTPTQRAMNLGLFEVKVSTVVSPNGTILETRTTKVTGKGQVYFVNKFHALYPWEAA